MNTKLKYNIIFLLKVMSKPMFCSVFVQRKAIKLNMLTSFLCLPEQLFFKNQNESNFNEIGNNGFVADCPPHLSTVQEYN